jgi:hypothetical protein
MRDKILAWVIGGIIGYLITIVLWSELIDLPIARKDNKNLQNRIESLEDDLRSRETELHECLNSVDLLKPQVIILEGVRYDRSEILVGTN